MNEALKYKMVWLVRMFFILANYFVFQISIIPVSASLNIFAPDHHTGISEIYTYDEIESSVGAEDGHTAGLSRVLSIKEVRPDH